ncbi:hypothetical protein SAMN04490239_1094 [Rhodococcus koreensis]|uniref:Uncharacterized protein n=2 Tax=Rhodococcus koreensis TaxID=99653 RepID=A0A1H4L6K8_9NOCA|nr:hypothetical protein SAMN04490239_1094 [Rhodococcus koreensis]
MALGAVSLATFWVFGLGFSMGIAAVVCGMLTISRSALAEDEVASLWALLGVIAGVVGGTASAIVALLPLAIHL